MASVFPVQGYVADSRRSLVRVDVYLVLSTVLLLVVGLMSLYSQSVSAGSPWFRKQLVNIGIGVVPFLIFAAVHPKVWRRAAPFLYGLSVGLLVFVLMHGKHTKGAGRWIQIGSIEFQPSELAKILTILTLATFYTLRQDRMERFSTFALGFLHVLIPTLLILKQPHLGATMVMLVMWFAVSLVAGIPLKSLATTAVAAVVLLGLCLTVPSLQSKLLHGYQQGRISGMIGHAKDVRGANWQTDRAEIAIGVGGVLGSGYLHGEQKAMGFIPEQQNDFIFTVIGEEGGLVGCTLVLLTYGFFFYRVWLAMIQTSDPFFKMVAGGIFAVLGFHTFVNIGMVLQLLPVVGLWLPFLSYGGTAIWLCMSCVGLLVAVRLRERPLLF